MPLIPNWTTALYTVKLPITRLIFLHYISCHGGHLDKQKNLCWFAYLFCKCNSKSQLYYIMFASVWFARQLPWTSSTPSFHPLMIPQPHCFAHTIKSVYHLCALLQRQSLLTFCSEVSKFCLCNKAT